MFYLLILVFIGNQIAITNVPFNSLVACQNAAVAVHTKKEYSPQLYCIDSTTGNITVE